ncbi:MAG: cyclic nucleotide-binding domain-containing protein [Thermoanaerobaculia bacterium]
MHDLQLLLAAHPFFAGLDPDSLATVTGCASNVKFEAGQTVLKEGDEANLFYIVRHGRIAVEAFSPTRGPLVIQTVEEGEILGWSWLVAPYKWRFDARALDLTRAIALDGKCLREKCETNHDLGYELLKRFTNVIGERLDATRLQMLDLYAAPVRGQR